MKTYINALDYILKNGESVKDRTNTGTKTIFGYQMRFNLNNGFPICTTKSVNFQNIISELFWFLEGSTDERRLAELKYEQHRKDLIGKKTIWTDNADNQGKSLGYTNTDYEKELGPIYGHQWTNIPLNDGIHSINQIKNAIELLKTDPDSRRNIVSAWNVYDIDKMSLPPCHVLFQFKVNNNKLYCQLYQRSADMFLGVPYNITSYSVLMHILAKICNLEVGEFIWTGGDCHIYNNHIQQVKEQISREPSALPTLEMPDFKDLDDLLMNYKPSDFKLINYNPQGSIKGKMAI